MHELGITRNVIAIVSDAADGRPVRRVTLEIGKLSGVMADAIAFCFDAVAEGTPLEGAKLDIREIDGRGRMLGVRSGIRYAGIVHALALAARAAVTRLCGEELKS